MGTIAARKRSNGTAAYTAQIRLKRAGQIIHTEAQTFDRKADAQAWLKRYTHMDEVGDKWAGWERMAAYAGQS